MNKGKFENNNISGMMHYIAGIYYSDKNLMEQAHENYYQAAEYFNRNEMKPAILTEIYYDLSIITRCGKMMRDYMNCRKR